MKKSKERIYLEKLNALIKNDRSIADSVKIEELLKKEGFSFQCLDYGDKHCLSLYGLKHAIEVILKKC